MRWKNFGGMSTNDGHKVFYSGEEDRHEYGVGFLVLKDIVNVVLGCRPVSNRLISIRLRAALSISPSYRFVHQNLVMMTVKSTTSTSNSRKPYTKHQRKTFWLYKGIGMLKLGRMHRQTGERFVGLTAMMRQMREVSDF